jgi:hypothetical protein
MIRRFIEWYFSPTQKIIPGEQIDLYSKINELEEKYKGLLMDIKHLEEENIETTNVLYQIMNSVEAVDARIDILAEHCGIVDDV